MADTYTQIHIQAIFAVKYREALIASTWKNELYGYMGGIIKNHSHKVLAINGVEDHVHLFFGFRPTQSLSDLMRIVKGESSEWINSRGFTQKRFRWQGGFAAFSYKLSDVKTIIRYIQNQERHHAKKKFLEEYRDYLNQFEIEYKEQYLYQALE